MARGGRGEELAALAPDRVEDAADEDEKGAVAAEGRKDHEAVHDAGCPIAEAVTREADVRGAFRQRYARSEQG